MNSFRWRSIFRLQYLIAFGLALLLPIISATANSYFPILRNVPFALYFISVIVVAFIGGLPPGLLAVLVSVTVRLHGLAVLDRPWHLRVWDLVIASVLALSAVLVSLFTTSRREVMEKLQERTDALIDSLHGAKCASWLIDVSRGENPRWYSGSYPVFGRPFSELETINSPVAFLHPEDRHIHTQIINHLKTSSEPLICEFRVLWPNGDVHWLECRGTHIPNTPSLWRGITMDITERKLTEAALLRSEKLAVMGRLASTVAHEINNPLEAVTNLLFLARGASELDETTRSYLSTAEVELARLGNITRLTLGFARTSEDRSNLDLVDVIENVLSIFRPRCEMKHIAIDRYFQQGVLITAAHHELRQIATNLIANAIDALNSSGGRIAIHIQREQSHAVLMVEDNGSGIDDLHLHRIFEPFFTTKADVGTGIGLWVTRELVHKNGGVISVTSGDLPLGMKTRFRAEFPLVS